MDSAVCLQGSRPCIVNVCNCFHMASQNCWGKETVVMYSKTPEIDSRTSEQCTRLRRNLQFSAQDMNGFYYSVRDQYVLKTDQERKY